MSMDDFSIRPVKDSDRAWVANFIARQWGAEIVIAYGVVFHASKLPGFVALRGDEKLGLVTYNIDDRACEIITLNSLQPGIGIGAALIDAVKAHARQAGCQRLFLMTANDNIDALRFYQKRGFVLVAVHRNAAEQARKLKPQIPFIGEHGIPLRDEIELEMML
jgi:ribosomal protein S18 acetylase RimI-like enzyme